MGIKPATSRSRVRPSRFPEVGWGGVGCVWGGGGGGGYRTELYM